jgi:hypothetical protein
MAVENLILTLSGHPDLRLRTITKNDIENLRNWKNANKNSFFLNQDITATQQEEWYGKFANKPGDHMFIVEQNVDDEWQSIGCMGFRKLDDEGYVDAYNIIRAHKIEPASFSMSDAFKGILAYAVSLYPGHPLQVKVLSHNPAVSWYEMNGFNIIGSKSDHVVMELDKKVLSNVNWSEDQYTCV